MPGSAGENRINSEARQQRIMSNRGGTNAGHIYSVMTYMWMFAMSLDDGPQLLEKYSQLKDIGRRVNTGTH